MLDLAEAGGGKAHHERLAKKGKMPIRERIINVLDPDSPFLKSVLWQPTAPVTPSAEVR